MPFVSIRPVRDTIADAPDQKEQLISNLVADAIKQATGLQDEDIWVVFEETDACDWFVGSTSVKNLLPTKQGRSAG